MLELQQSIDDYGPDSAGDYAENLERVVQLLG